MEQRDVDKAIKKVREEFAASLAALEAKLETYGSVEVPNTFAIDGRLSAHDEAHSVHHSRIEELSQQVASGSVRVADATVTRLEETIEGVKSETGKLVDGLRGEFERIFGNERAGTANKISGLSDKVDSHVAETEKRLTDQSGELTEQINSVRRRIDSAS